MIDQGKERAIKALRRAEEVCSLVLATLSQAERETVTSEPNHELSILLNDFVSLLSLLHDSVTKLSLALKPSSPTYSASVIPLEDIANRITGLSHCIHLLDPQTHGASLIREIESVSKEIIGSIKSLVHLFLEFASGAIVTSNPSSGKAGEEYLVITGAIHAAIDHARGSPGISKDNAYAVSKKWAENQECLEDGLRELAKTIQEQTSDSAEEKDDDGWDELGISSGEKMSSTEIETAKKVHSILRLGSLLHKRILKYVLSPLRDSPDLLSVNRSLDKLLETSITLLNVSDDFASATDTSQGPAATLEELELYLGQIDEIESSLEGLKLKINEFEVEPDLSKLSLDSGNGTSTAIKTLDKWFITCFGQIRSLSKSIYSC